MQYYHSVVDDIKMLLKLIKKTSLGNTKGVFTNSERNNCSLFLKTMPSFTWLNVGRQDNN